jgi:Tfp pilus assembly protein PilP
MKLVILFLFLISLSGGVMAQTKKVNFKNAGEVRDPFKRKRFKRQREKRKFGGTAFNNLPTIDGIPIDQIQIIGVLLGQTRRALAKVLDASGKESKDTFTLKEGMNLGLNNAEIKAILPGGIVLVEKIRNVYDEDEYLETILPVSIE